MQITYHVSLEATNDACHEENGKSHGVKGKVRRSMDVQASTWNCAIIISSASVTFRLQNVCRMQTSPRDWAVIELDETFRHQVTGGMFVEGYLRSNIFYFSLFILQLLAIFLRTIT